MSGVVSYDLFVSRLGSSGAGFTTEGGIYATFINATGAASIKGTIVSASTTTDNAVGITPASSDMPIGVIYENGIANGSSVKVVICGKAEVLLKDTVAGTHGYWCGVSDTNGRMTQAATAPATTEHWREIGHGIISVAAGTNVLALIQLHFN